MSSIQEWLDPAAADEIVDRTPPVLELVETPAPVAGPGRVTRAVKATGRGLRTLVLLLVGVAAGTGAGFGYGAGLVEGATGRVDLLPSYAAWPTLWWVLLASVPLTLAVAIWKPLRAIAFGYLLALPWQLVACLVYASYTFATWGYTPTP